MLEEKKYPRAIYNDDVFKYNAIIVFLLFVFVIIFFNNAPVTKFEIFLNSILIKEVGIYSKIYPFQSQILSNLIMWATPVSALSLALTVRFDCLSEKEITDLGGKIERNTLKIIFMKIISLLFVFSVVLTFSYPVYLYYATLDEVAIRTSFVRDSLITVIFLPYLFYLCSMSLMGLFLGIVFHPINFFKYQYKIPYVYDKKDRVRLLMKNRRKNR